ncbi:hypothetical protein Atai01_52160 [Amycolatopsis taiwanensis]|uniref:Uncharacterized protein n=1 Tax=Amycolatopsis taiwanensis TaxID=342230 RepID=A0A9W6R6P1_9PSEU|nr:hypothetical protein Atai01_52160 [Amycolatopsis taiwanensis]
MATVPPQDDHNRPISADDAGSGGVAVLETWGQTLRLITVVTVPPTVIGLVAPYIAGAVGVPLVTGVMLVLRATPGRRRRRR